MVLPFAISMKNDVQSALLLFIYSSDTTFKMNRGLLFTTESSGIERSCLRKRDVRMNR